MKLERSTGNYQNYFNRSGEGICHVTKFLVDETSVTCNNVILCQYSDLFQGQHDIFLLEFNGHLDTVYDIMELFHGYDVDVNISNVESIAKFGVYYKCKDLTNLVEKWLEEQLRKVTDPENIISLTKIVLNLFKLGYTQIIKNKQIKETITANVKVVIKGLEAEHDNLFVLYFMLSPQQIKSNNLNSRFFNFVDSEKKYKRVLTTIDEVMNLDSFLVLNKNTFLEPLFRLGADLISTKEMFKFHYKIEGRYLKFQLDVANKVIERAEVTEIAEVLKTYAWKDYDWKQLLQLKQKPGVTDIQYFALVLYMMQENKYGNEVRHILCSSIQKNLCHTMHCYLDQKALRYDNRSRKESNRIFYGYLYTHDSIDFSMERFTLICHDSTLTLLQKGDEKIEIKNIDGFPLLEYSYLKDQEFLFWFAHMERIEGKYYEYSGFNSTLTNKYDDFVNYILFNNWKSGFNLCGVYKNKNYNEYHY